MYVDGLWVPARAHRLAIRQRTAAGSSAFAGGLGWAVSAVIALIAGFGALALKGWAWILGLLASGLSLASALWGALQGGSWLFSAPGLILPAVVFIYLLTPGVRKAFGRAEARPALKAESRTCAAISEGSRSRQSKAGG